MLTLLIPGVGMGGGGVVVVTGPAIVVGTVTELSIVGGGVLSLADIIATSGQLTSAGGSSDDLVHVTGSTSEVTGVS